MSLVLIIQARCNSSRLPGKVLLPMVDNRVTLELMLERVKKCKRINDIIIATTINPEDDEVCSFCAKNNVKCYRGSETDVLDRYYRTAQLVNAKYVMRCTGDCPLIDWKECEKFIDQYFNSDSLYQGTKYIGQYPSGFDMELFTFESLEIANLKACEPSDREHVTPYIKRVLCNNCYPVYELDINVDISNLELPKVHLSLDTKRDYKVIRYVFQRLYAINPDFTYTDVLRLLNENSSILDEVDEAVNVRKSKNSLVSPAPRLWFEEKLKYQKAKGIEISTSAGIKIQDYVQRSFVLGYTDVDVNREAQICLSKGDCILSHPREEELADELLKIHPWADKALFTSSSREAFRILSESFGGVNRRILVSHRTSMYFPDEISQEYPDLSTLRYFVEKKNSGGMCVVMDIDLENMEENKYLCEIVDICKNKDILVIFNETVTGFRFNIGGVHLLYKIEPDLVVFGNNIANGFPMGAIIGNDRSMKKIKIGYVVPSIDILSVTAAIKTIQKFNNCKVAAHLIEMGTLLWNGLDRIIWNKKLGIVLSGTPQFIKITFLDPGRDEELFFREMLEEGILMSGTIVLSYSHKKEHIDHFLSIFEKVISKYQRRE